jgi:hypothetical protein
MSLSRKLSEHVAACFTGLYVVSHEHEDALAGIARLCKERSWRLAVWDVDRGLRVGGGTGEASPPGAGAADPLAALRALPAMASEDSSALLVLPNFHRFLGSAEVVQAVAHAVAAGKQGRTFVVVLSPVVQIPAELEKLFAVIEHELPDRAQLEAIARGIATQPGELPDGDGLGAVLDAAAGLTRYEAEGALALSLVRQGKVTPATLWELKAQALKKSGLLTLHRGQERFADLGGLDALKTFCLKALRPGERHPLAKPRGILLLGVPGTGKSAFAKALGNETGRPTLTLDFGSLLGSLVGQSEANLRQALRSIDAMGPSVVFADELEKSLGGAASGGGGDSGVGQRMFGSLLSWLSDRESDSFFIGTANDVSRLPPEFSRAERFDAVFFLDLPSAQEKAAIWSLYLKRFALDAGQAKPADQNWTGAEIRSCCRLAKLLDAPLTEAAKNVVPVAVTAAESVERLRNWASGRCLSAYRPGLYVRESAGTAGAPERTGRKVARPGNN